MSASTVCLRVLTDGYTTIARRGCKRNNGVSSGFFSIVTLASHSARFARTTGAAGGMLHGARECDAHARGTRRAKRSGGDPFARQHRPATRSARMRPNPQRPDGVRVRTGPPTALQRPAQSGAGAPFDALARKMQYEASARSSALARDIYARNPVSSAHACFYMMGARQRFTGHFFAYY